MHGPNAKLALTPDNSMANDPHSAVATPVYVSPDTPLVPSEPYWCPRLGWTVVLAWFRCYAPIGCHESYLRPISEQRCGFMYLAAL